MCLLPPLLVIQMTMFRIAKKTAAHKRSQVSSNTA